MPEPHPILEDFYNTTVEFATVKLGELFLADNRVWAKTTARILEGGVFVNCRTPPPYMPTNPLYQWNYMGWDKVRINTLKGDT